MPHLRDDLTPTPRSDPWERFARAFVHEARSPLNALGIYLELLAPKEAGAQRPGAQPARLVERAQDQVRRVTDLLACFSDLWAPRAGREGVDLAALGRAAGRFAQHEAVRQNVGWTSSIADGLVVPVAAPPSALAHALLLLLDGALAVPAESTLELTIAAAAPQLRLAVSPPPDDSLTAAGLAAFVALGASVERSGAGLAVSFPR